MLPYILMIQARQPRINQKFEKNFVISLQEVNRTTTFAPAIEATIDFESKCIRNRIKC